MPVDPRLNCAAQICCDADDARVSQLSLLADLGVKNPGEVADAMAEAGLIFMPCELGEAISKLADHPNRKKPKGTHGEGL